MHRSEEFFFAWEGAAAPEGPWSHLLVLEAVGTEAMSRPYEYVIDLVCATGTPEVSVGDLVGARATLKLRTRATPAVRFVHGVISEVEELGDVDGVGRFRVHLTPPFTMARMLRRCAIHVDKKLIDILDQTLTRGGRGMALEKSTGDSSAHPTESPDYQTPRATYAWRVLDVSRLHDERARPYCVQYEESDVAFVERLLEEEGIAYHFEHTDTECRLVFADQDSSRLDLQRELVLSRDGLNTEVRDMRLGGRMRPTAYGLVDYDWRKPDLFLAAVGGDKSEQALGTLEQPGRFQYTQELGQGLADARFGRLESERRFGSLSSACRALAAGVVVAIEHPRAQFSGSYLVTKTQVHLRQPGHFAASDTTKPAYEVRLEVLSTLGGSGPDDSHFRPERLTPRPRIGGSQTAVVTSEPGVEQEINVGGDADVGSVRLRFHWDLARAKDETMPTSCWVRVSQTFAGGAGHGAIWNPRVGDEVIVEYLEGDPDRPIVTGRVYNGKNLSPENITNNSTYSCIKSMTSPYNGNFNLLSFQDQQNEELITIHAARDFHLDVERNSNIQIGDFSFIHVHGKQTTIIDGFQKTDLNASQAYTVTGSQKVVVTTTQTVEVGINQLTSAGILIKDSAGSTAQTVAPIILESGSVNATQATSVVESGVTIKMAAKALVSATGDYVSLEAGSVVSITGGTVHIGAAHVNIIGGTITASGSSINLNC